MKGFSGIRAVATTAALSFMLLFALVLILSLNRAPYTGQAPPASWSAVFLPSNSVPQGNYIDVTLTLSNFPDEDAGVDRWGYSLSVMTVGEDGSYIRHAVCEASGFTAGDANSASFTDFDFSEFAAFAPDGSPISIQARISPDCPAGSDYVLKFFVISSDGLVHRWRFDDGARFSISEPTATATATAEGVPTPTATDEAAAAAADPAHTATATPTATVDPAHTATATATADPAHTATATATADPAHTATDDALQTRTITDTATVDAVHTETITRTAESKDGGAASVRSAEQTRSEPRADPSLEMVFSPSSTVEVAIEVGLVLTMTNLPTTDPGDELELVWDVGTWSGTRLTPVSICLGELWNESTELHPVSGTAVMRGTIAATCPPSDDYAVQAKVNLVARSGTEELVAEVFSFVVKNTIPSLATSFSPSSRQRQGRPVDIAFNLSNLPTDPAEYGQMVYELGVFTSTTSGGSAVYHHAYACEGAGFPNSGLDTFATVPFTPTSALKTISATVSDGCPAADGYLARLRVSRSQDFSDTSKPVVTSLEEQVMFEIVGLTPTAAMRFSPADAVPSGSSIGLALTLSDLIETESGETLRLVWDAGTLAGEAFTANTVCRGGGSLGETTDLAPVSGTQTVAGTVSDLCPQGSYVVRVSVQLASGGDVQTLLTKDFDFTITPGTPSASVFFDPSAQEKAGTSIDVDFGLKHLPVDAAAYGEMIYTLGVYSTTMSGGKRVYHHAYECEGTGFANSARGTLVNVPITPTRALETVAVAISERCPADDYVLQLKVVVSDDFSDPSETTEEILSGEYAFEILKLDPAADLAFMPADTVNHGKPIGLTLTLTEMPETGANESIQVLWEVARLAGSLLTPEPACKGDNFGTRSGLVPVSGTIVITGTTIARTCPAGDNYVVRVIVQLVADGTFQYTILSELYPFKINDVTPTAELTFSPSGSVAAGTPIALALALSDLIETESGETLQLVWDVGTVAAEGAFTAAADCRGGGSLGETTDLAPVSGAQAVTGTVSELCPHGSYVVRVGVQLASGGAVQTLLTEDFDFTVTRGTASATAVFSPSASEKAGTPVDVALAFRHLPTDPAEYGEMIYTLGVFTTTASGGTPTFHRVFACEGAGFQNSSGAALVNVPITPTMTLETVAVTISERCPAGDYELQLTMTRADDFSASDPTIELIFSRAYAFEILELNPDAELAFSPSATVGSGTPIGLTLTLSEMPLPAANESIRVLWGVGSLSGGVLTSEAACEGDNFGARSGLVPVSGTIVVTGTTIASTCPVGNDYVVRATVQLVADGSVQSTVLVEDFPFAIRVPSPSVDAAFSPSDSEREGTAIDVVFSLRHLPTDPNNYGEMIYTLGVYSTTSSGGTPTLRHAHGCEGAGFANRAREALVSVPITPTATLETVAATISGRCPPGDYVVQFDVKSSPDFGALNPVVELIASGAFPFEIVGLTPTAAMRFSPADAAPSGSSIGLALTLTDLIETESGETLQLVWDVGTLAGEAFTANAVCRGAGSFGETTDLAPVSGTQAVTGTVSELCPHGSYVVRVGVQLDADGDVQALLTEDFDFTITRGTPSAGAVFGPSALEKAGTRIDVDFKLNHLPADAAAYGEMVYTLGVFTTTASGGNTDYHHVHECEGPDSRTAPQTCWSPFRSRRRVRWRPSRRPFHRRCPPGRLRHSACGGQLAGFQRSERDDGGDSERGFRLRDPRAQSRRGSGLLALGNGRIRHADQSHAEAVGYACEGCERVDPGPVGGRPPERRRSDAGGRL